MKPTQTPTTQNITQWRTSSISLLEASFERRLFTSCFSASLRAACCLNSSTTLILPASSRVTSFLKTEKAQDTNRGVNDGSFTGSDWVSEWSSDSYKLWKESLRRMYQMACLERMWVVGATMHAVAGHNILYCEKLTLLWRHREKKKTKIPLRTVQHVDKRRRMGCSVSVLVENTIYELRIYSNLRIHSSCCCCPHKTKETLLGSIAEADITKHYVCHDIETTYCRHTVETR